MHLPLPKKEARQEKGLMTVEPLLPALPVADRRMADHSNCPQVKLRDENRRDSSHAHDRLDAAGWGFPFLYLLDADLIAISVS